MKMLIFTPGMSSGCRRHMEARTRRQQNSNWQKKKGTRQWDVVPAAEELCWPTIHPVRRLPDPQPPPLDRSLRPLRRTLASHSANATQHSRGSKARWQQTQTQTHRRTDAQTHRRTDTQTHRRTDAQTHKRTDAQTHRRTDAQTHTQRQTWGTETGATSCRPRVSDSGGLSQDIKHSCVLDAGVGGAANSEP
jgi:hypothetical protein